MAKSPEFIELFAGCGGMALGLEQAGLDPMLLVEKDNDCVKTLEANRPWWDTFHGSVTDADYSGLEPEVVTGGWPCQAFSTTGKRLGFLDQTRGTLFFEFARCVQETRPKIIVGENVQGLLNHAGGRTFSVMVAAISSLGYRVEHKLLSAEYHGIPQKRDRVIVLGTREDLHMPVIFPEPEGKARTLRGVLDGCPDSPGIKYPESKRKVMELVPPGGHWRDLPVEVAKQYLGKVFDNTEGGRTTYARRISWDEPCLTLTCSPSQKQTERCHPDETRPFTVRESARIQTFPDSWIFCGSVGSQYRQIGNAVPVELARRIGLSVLAMLKSAGNDDSLLSET